MESPSAMPTASIAADAIILAEIDALLRNRLSRDPDLRRLVELVATWLARSAASSPASLESAAETPLASIATASAVQSTRDSELAAVAESLPRSTFDSHAPTAEPMLAIEPEAPPPDAAQLAELLEKFTGSAVSPVRAIPTRTLSTHAAPVSRRRVSDLEPLARRMDLKADSCSWAVRRYDELVAGNGFDPVKAEYEEIRGRAGTMQPCFLWMIHPDSQSIGRDDWIRLEGCYRACAEVLKTILEFPDAYESEPELLKLLGETQSAIRAGMAACGAMPQWIDLDQQQVFEWCKAEGEVKRLFNPYLGLDRLADPSLHGGMLARARKLHSDLKERKESVRERRRGLNTIRYHIEQLEDGAENTEHHWARIAEGVEMTLRGGAPPSLPELVDAIVPVADDVPEHILDHRGVRQVMRFVDQRLSASEARDPSPALTARTATPQVLLVREALRGSRVVLIGGEQRTHSKEVLEREFELAALEWPTSEEHQSISSFEPVIARSDTKLVIVMIRWASHSFEGVQEICRKYGKAFVRLPGGYNPSQVAHQIVEQASAQLGIQARSTSA